MNFADKLINAVKVKNNPTVAGLDPRKDYVPRFIIEKAFRDYGEADKLKASAYAIFEFNRKLIDALYDIVPAVKLQSAFYEMLGPEGIGAFIKTGAYARSKGLIVIADAKRGDIGSTAEAYAEAYLGEGIFDADALTVNPYLGIDGVKPFIDKCAVQGKGIFILVKTSNKSSGDFQDLVLNGPDSSKPLYEAVAEKVNIWGKREDLTGECGYSSIGAVVGATYPEQAVKLRQIMEKALILVPGYGAQGGTAADAAKSFDKDGQGAIVNASRSIMCAYLSPEWKEKFTDPEDAALYYDEAARAEALRMRDDLNKALGKELSCAG